MKPVGFSEPISIRKLMTVEGIDEVDKVHGLYLVLYTEKVHPEFLEVGTGGHFKGRDPNVSIEILESKWIEDTEIIYIGQTTKTLRSRIKSYMQFGQGEPVGHWGGRYIWQMAGSCDLLLCWKPLSSNEDPEDGEKSMLREFRDEFGKLPFANLKE
jgi:hypothetical protein